MYFILIQVRDAVIIHKGENYYVNKLIFVFAATPSTPDDLIWIPLGMMKYPKLRALLAAIAGKIVLNLIYAYLGTYAFKFIQPYFHS